MDLMLSRLAHGNWQDVQLVYQPKVDISSFEIVGCEALVRLRSEGRVLSPAHFLGKIRDTRTYTKLTYEIFERAMWHRSEFEDFKGRMAINVCPKLFCEDAFYAMMQGAMRICGLEGKDIEVEILEDRPLEGDLEQKARVMAQSLQQLGIAITIDDYHYGNHSVGHLRALRPDYVKLDKEIVHGVYDPRSRDMAITLIDGILASATRDGYELVAEGVEETAQAAWFAAKGVVLQQGYLYSMPLSRVDYQRLIGDPSSLFANI